MLTVVRALLLAALLTFVPVGIGIAVSADPTPEAPPSAYSGTTLTETPVSALPVRRAGFCDRIHPDAVVGAVGADSELTAWANGQTTVLPSGEDVAHEFGCSYDAPAGGSSGSSGSSAAVRARAWVFAPPVTTDEAKKLVAQVPKGCAAQPSAPAYGDPSVAMVCTTSSTREASYRGLFGDAWLACSLTVPVATKVDDLTVRASRWCVAVAQAASGS